MPAARAGLLLCENLAAADEVNNFVRIAGLHGRLLPDGARQDIEVALNRDALGRDAKMREKGDDIQGIGNVARFPVNRNSQDLCSCGADLAFARSA